MGSSLPKPFPSIKSSELSKIENPAIRLFGNRFYSEQTVVEFLAEFLAILLFPKKIGDEVVETPLPSTGMLNELSWHSEKLKYRPPVKLNLKLFSFLSASRVDSRHKVHTDHYQNLLHTLEKNIQVNNWQVEDVKEWVEELLRGFQGAGFDRTWCAQSFFPVTESLLTQETLWNITVARKYAIDNWDDSIDSFHKYYSVSKHRFLARGGELLYLQLCNAFLTKQSKLQEFVARAGFDGDDFCGDEIKLDHLHQALQNSFPKLSGQYTQPLDQLVDYIESLDEETHHRTNKKENWLTCEWCPRDSWREGFLFAVETKRLLDATLDPVERLQMLMTGCGLQVLRSLTAQSVRYAEPPQPGLNIGGALGYAWIFSSPKSTLKKQRYDSQRNLQAVQSLIQKALRHEDLQKLPRTGKTNPYIRADSKHGHGLFLSLGKKMGIIVPYTGPGARFVMTDAVLRYLVLVLLRPGERCTYDRFLKRLYLHYGIAIEGHQLDDAAGWSELPAISRRQTADDSWLAEMLRAGGFLMELSDACSIVRNTFNEDK